MLIYINDLGFKLLIQKKKWASGRKTGCDK